jgi:PAS domain S-box-containing protein
MVINQGRIVYVNRATLGLLGAASATLVLGRSPLDFVLPTDRGAVDEAFKTATDRSPAARKLSMSSGCGSNGTTIDVEV